MRRGPAILFLAFLACGPGMSVAAEPAKTETQLETAKRLADSKDQKERAQALQLLKALGQPGKPEGDEALARYGDLGLRFYAEGDKTSLAESKRAYAELKEKSHSRWGLHGAVGLLRVSAAEGQSDDAIKGLDVYMATHSQDDSTVDAGYHLGGIRVVQFPQNDIGKTQAIAGPDRVAFKRPHNRIVLGFQYPELQPVILNSL